MKQGIKSTVLPLLVCLFLLFQKPVSAQAPKPNIVLILADDMGFSDPGCFGSEISTPNLDTLASHGLRFTQFYNGARCCPSRAQIMTGLYAHEAGQGYMTDDETATAGDGYSGGLNRRCMTVAEVLKTAGYSTYMVGKWHMVAGADYLGSDTNDWPRQRGFDRYFGMIHGSANYYTGRNANGAMLVAGNDTMTAPAGFYTTNNFADTAVKFISEHFANTPTKPFFLYAAFNAPHYPLQALKVDIDKYRTNYTIGWDSLRPLRYKRQIQLGIINPVWPLSPADAPTWSTLAQTQKDTMALKMAIYAAQVDRLDQNIGKIVAQLKTSNAFDNTLIIFLSDNGACAEGGNYGAGPNNLLETTQGQLMSYGQGWAHASNTPFQMYKHYTREGGISSPFIAHWPSKITGGRIETHEVGHIIDLMPTFIEVSGATYPLVYKGYLMTPLVGKSLVKAFTNADTGRAGWLFWEHEGNKATRIGKWKLVSNNGAAWHLFDMVADRTEITDLASANAAMVTSMDAAWNAWATADFVLRLPTDTIATSIRIVAPATGEQVTAKTSYQIQWGATTDAVKNVRLYYQTVSGGAWTSITDSTPHTGSFSWTVPDTHSVNVRIRIVSINGMWKDTTGVFSIVPGTGAVPRAARNASALSWRVQRNGIRFVNIPRQSSIRVYDLRGASLSTMPCNGGEAFLDGRRFGSLVCIIEIKSPGKIRIIRNFQFR
jgi:arylsulfatase